QLAGYTVAIVGIPAALAPTGAYPLVVARCTEILLGIVCAALVSRLVLVRDLSPKLIELVRALARRADRFATILLQPNADRERLTAVRTELAKAYLDVNAMQGSTYFESAEARVLDQPLRRLTQAAVELCTTAEAAASHRAGLLLHPERISPGTAISDTSESPTGDGPIVSALVRAPDERDVGFARARFRESMRAFDLGEELPEPNIACRLWSDPVPAVLTGIRSALAVGITCAFWFATAWPNGPAAVVVAAVVCSLLASLEQPDKISMAAAATVLIAGVPVFTTQFYLMPLAVDFPSMAVALAPLMLTCGFIMAQPRIGPLGLLSAVYFAFASNIDNVMTYDAAAFLNASLAILVGIAVAVVLFATFFPETPAFAARRFRRQLFVHLSYLTSACPCGPALRCYQRALCEQLGATLARVKDEPKLAHECLTSALAALSAAQAIGRLKSALDGSMVAPAIAAKGSRLLARLSQTLRNPSVWKFSRRAGEARALGRHALAAARGSAEPEEIKALRGIIVGSATLGSISCSRP
ncbi:MAG: FUSC family protein, partial [Xanthobacteraceae bacterium]